AYREQRGDGTYPSILINSIDLKRLLDLAGAERLDELTDYLLRELERLARAGADVALFASNTPHLVFEEVRRRAPIPLLSIVEAACAAAEAQGLTRVGLLGTRFTMQARFYPDVFARAAIRVVVPDAEEQRWVHDRYVHELIPAIFRPETRERMLALVARMKARDGIEGVILGGTELPLLLRDASGGIPLLDTTRIHADCAVAQLLAHGAG
ncbi:MAG TPA: amino acid racemase, partial [Gemmatimonadales bacterium]